MMERLAQGAEAVIFRDADRILKERIPKSYRLAAIDDRLRRVRTRKEVKILKSLPVPGPGFISVDMDRMIITMSYLDGPRVVDILEQSDYRAVSHEIGVKLRTMHDHHIIHGDLTTSNMILFGELHFIDFGLSFTSTKIEDKAVDLHLLRTALESKHYTIWEACFAEVLKGYNDPRVALRLDQVEGRGRYK
jgi:Kae1-associated kinase Bud32